MHIIYVHMYIHICVLLYSFVQERDVVSLLFAEDIHHIIDNTDDLVKVRT